MGLSPSKAVSSRVDQLETTMHDLNNRLEKLDPQDRFTRYNERLREIESSTPQQTDRLNTLAENVETLQSNIQTIEHNLQELQGPGQQEAGTSACLPRIRTSDDGSNMELSYAYMPTATDHYQETDAAFFDNFPNMFDHGDCNHQTITDCFGIYKGSCVDHTMENRCQITETGFTWNDFNGKDVHVMMCAD